MASYYCTSDYEGLSECFYKRFTGENPYKNWSIDKAIKELDDFVKGYKKEKKQYDFWMNAKFIENPKNNKEQWFNAFWTREHSENSLYAKDMDIQKKQFDAMEKAILRWLPVSGILEKEQNKILKKIQTRKSKLV